MGRSTLYVLLVAVWLVPAAWGCPVCDTETGQQVRQEIFNEQFARNAFLTLAPLAPLVGVILLITGGRSHRRGNSSKVKL